MMTDINTHNIVKNISVIFDAAINSPVKLPIKWKSMAANVLRFVLLKIQVNRMAPETVFIMNYQNESVPAPTPY